MVNLRRSFACVFIILVLLAVFVGLGNATTTYLTVKSGKEVTHPINLVVDDRVLIQFTATGGEVDTLHFSINFPNATVKDFGEVGKVSYSFVCDVEGEYTLNFTNNDQTDKAVTLNYEIDHYIFGMPQMLFLTLIIVVACVVGVFVFVMLGKSY